MPNTVITKSSGDVLARGDTRYMQGCEREVLPPRKSSAKTHKVCPLCNGKGFFLDDKKSPFLPSEEGYGDRTEPTLEAKLGQFKEGNRGTPKKDVISLPQIGFKIEADKKPRATNRKQSVSQKQGFAKSIARYQAMENVTTPEADDVLPPPKFVDNIPELLNRARTALKSTNMDSVVAGIEDIIQVVRQDAFAILPMMTTVNRAIIECLKSPKQKYVRIGAQAAGEIFQYSKVVSRPEYDEIINILLLKTGDSTKIVRSEAMDALHSLVDYMPLPFAVKAIVYTAPKHKNSLVRMTVMKLIERILSMVTPRVILVQPVFREPRKKILEVIIQSISDPHPEIRNLSRLLFRTLASEEEFEDALSADISADVIKRMEQVITLLTYHT